MITAEELRIGNWVLDPDGNPLLLSEKELAFLLINDFQQLGCDPIAISPDILEKCGFEKSSEPHIFNRAEYKYSIGGDWFYLIYDENEILLAEDIKHIHQLQNLYYCLTGTELTINL